MSAYQTNALDIVCEANEKSQAGQTQSSPSIVIEARHKWTSIDLQELWGSRELLYLLAWRDIKVRYKQTFLGAFWAVLQPLLGTVVFGVLFGKLMKVPSEGVAYPIFAYAGLLPWTFFSNAVSNGSNSLVGSSALVTKVYFPRMLVPAAVVLAGLVDFAIAAFITFGLMAYYGVWPRAGIVMLPALIVLLSITALSVAVWLSALNVRYRDVRYAVPFIVQVWLYLSPVIYPVTLLPKEWRWTMLLNPLTGILEGFHSAFLGKPFDWQTLAGSTVITCVMLLYATYRFHRMEEELADII